MIKKWIVALAAMLTTLGLFAAPASASVPDWDKSITWEQNGFAVRTPAEWDAIKTVLDSPEDLAYARNLPASPLASAKRSYDECPEMPPTGSAETFCLWNGYEYTGTVWKLPKSWLGDTNGVNAYNGLSFYGSGINNTSKSWYNRTYYSVRLFDNDSCQNSGWYRTMSSDTWAFSYDANSNDWENRISSISILAYAGNYCYSTPGQ